MKLKFEHVDQPTEYVRRVWKRNIRTSKLQEYYDAIKTMTLEDSFEVEAVYAEADSIRKAFKLRGWKCTCRAIRTEKKHNELYVFKIRVWRVK